MLKYLLLFLISFSVSLLLTPLVRLMALRLGVLDCPGERKVHQEPIPRLGGVAVILSVLIGLAVAVGLGQLSEIFIPIDLSHWTPMLVGWLFIFAAGLWDDIRPLPAGIKFLFQAAAAGSAIVLGIQIHEISLFGTSTLELGILSIPITFLWLVGITNAFNLVDGLDGLAAGLASIAAGTCATIFILHGEVQSALLLVVLLGSLLGFLRYNFNPAKIFLGDSGSQIIGYTLAIAAIAESQKKAMALAVIVPLLVFGIPILDTLLSMVRRFIGELKMVQPYRAPLKQNIFKAKQMFAADQGHIHHRLIDLGFSHRHAVLFLYGLALVLSGLALLSVLSQYRNAGIILMVVGLATFIGVGKLGYKEMTLLSPETFLRWYERVAFNRLFFIGILDLVFISFAYWMTFVLKYGFVWSPILKEWHVSVFPLVLLLQFAVFLGFGLYRGVWRATGVGDLIRISLAVFTAASLSFAVVRFSMLSGEMSFFIIDLLLLIVLVVTARGLYKVIDYSNWSERSSHHHGVLIYGAGKNGQLVLRQLLQDEDFGLRPLGFLDDAPELQGRTVNSTPVLGTCNDLPAILESYDIDRVVVASGKLLTKHLLSVAEICRRSGIPIVQAEVRLILSEMNSKMFLDDYGKKKQLNSEILDKTESDSDTSSESTSTQTSF